MTQGGSIKNLGGNLTCFRNRNSIDIDIDFGFLFLFFKKRFFRGFEKEVEELRSLTFHVPGGSAQA